MNQISHPPTDVVILCGGFGTRLKNRVDDRPKPMVEVAGRPFLDILIAHMEQYGFRRFILCTGYKSTFIEKYYTNNEDGRSFIFSEEKEPLGTAGAIKNAETFIQSNVFFVLNGDSFCQININNFLSFHQQKRATASIALSTVDIAKDYGTIKLSTDERVTSFNEKSSWEGTGLVNAGIYIFDRTILQMMPAKKKYSLEYDFFPMILDSGVYGYRTGEKLFDIGTPERLEKAAEHFRSLHVPTRNINMASS